MRSSSASSSKPTRVPTNDFGQHVPPLPSFPSEQAVPQKVVVRKKSGFMRLFNGKERASPPPMPSMSNTSMPSPSSISSVPTRKTPHRVPVPSMSPSLDAYDHGVWATSGSSVDSQATIKEQLNARRNAPGLSIVTSSSSSPILGSSLRGPSSSPAISDPTYLGSSLTPTTATTNTDSFLDGSMPPNSAPPNSADFLGLSLRPVSTLFSTDLAGHLIRTSTEQRPSLDMDSGTPTTSSGISPMSPGFSIHLNNRSGADEKSVVGIASHQDDQSAVIQALQEQIMVARRGWQRQIWELEGQVRDLKAEVEEFRNAENLKEYCAACGRGHVGRSPAEPEIGVEELQKAGVKVSGVVNRPRARTGISSRFASGT
ncbi:hypothetical protein EUX98_g630 [Antrodiella citrinella]|uniref:Uncharacterized protein n=1 Tax=Antrodiella citrinella TaxID=2447956 RepID=A0A4S4N6I5_9APHY|nr:hypothetical protein EUX98_g630 [Antrodiella citrinella]